MEKSMLCSELEAKADVNKPLWDRHANAQSGHYVPFEGDL